MQRYEIAIIIVSYNVKYYVEQCLDSLQKSLVGIENEIWVVDNHSHDGSVEYLQTRFPQVKFIACTHNNGFAHANNIALKQCNAEFVLLLNPDTFVGENTLHEMLAFMRKNEKAGAAGVQMLGADGNRAMESRRGIPSPMVSFYKMCGLCARFPKHRRFGKYYMGYLPWHEPARIEVVSGACFMVRKSVIDKIGMLDEDFFMYGEDIDLSCRILKADYENWYLPSRILHYKGESTQKTSFRYVHVFYQAMLIFFRKHYKHLRFWLSIPIKAAIYTKAATSLIKIQMQMLRHALALGMKRRTEPFYIFIGNEEMIAKARILAQRKGLDAEFIRGNAQTMPQGHNQLDDMPERQCIAVYDTDAFSYKAILDIIALHPQRRITVGTFNTPAAILITSNEVIKL